MRIAFVPAARLLTDTEPNGEGLIATDLLRRLGARGHEIVAWCERADLSDPIDGVQIREVPAHGRTAALGRIAFANRIAREVARERFDVAHLLFPFTTDTGYSSVRSAPLIVGPVNLPWPGREARSDSVLARAASAFTTPLERSLHRRTLARASRILVTGTSSFTALPASVHRRVTEVPFGVDIDRFAPTPVPADPSIVFLASLAERKGAAVLIRAMRRVFDAVPGARLVLAGGDPEDKREYLERLAETTGVGHAVTFSGRVEPAEVAGLFSSARVVCAPSFGEPFGMNVIEAMASARAVVGTLGGGIADAVEHGRGGLLVPQGDHNALGDALVEALSPGRAEEMAAFNRSRAEQRYAIGHVLDRIETAYEAAASLQGVAHGS